MLIALALVGIVLALAAGYAWGRRAVAASDGAALPSRPTTEPASVPTATKSSPEPPPADRLLGERARLARSLEAEAAALRAQGRSAAADLVQLRALAEERRALFVALAESHAETARWRDVAVAIEDNAAPPLLGGPGAPDDLKLIVGIGPVLERMLHQLGITSYRQIARWSEHDIDAVDAKLAEFRGRIRRDAWVTQARTLHQSVHGEAP